VSLAYRVFVNNSPFTFKLWVVVSSVIFFKYLLSKTVVLIDELVASLGSTKLIALNIGMN
jgi:hypothetical protein